jgi:hypothetical protein
LSVNDLLGEIWVWQGRILTMGKPSVTPPTVLSNGDVMPPTTGRPFVVSSTVFRRLERDGVLVCMYS